MIITDNSELDIYAYAELALEAGFTTASPLCMESLELRQEVREMCSADLCKSWGRNWSCPPAAGSLDVISDRISKYDRGIVVQTTGEMRDDFDMAAIKKIHEQHNRSFDILVRQIRQIEKDCFPMGAGACQRCRKCTYPDRPCRHPDKMYLSMEACGLLVSDVCRRSGIKYNYGSGTMTFTSCILMADRRN